VSLTAATGRKQRHGRLQVTENEASHLLTRADAAAALAISTDSLGRLIKNGELGVVRIGRSVLVPQEDVVALIARRRSAPRRSRPLKCSRCGLRIRGARIVIEGRWTCSRCVYELERAQAEVDETRGVLRNVEENRS
jgi:excisionase family DNA binding protein